MFRGVNRKYIQSSILSATLKGRGKRTQEHRHAE